MAKTEDLLKRIKELEQENYRLKEKRACIDFEAVFSNSTLENSQKFRFDFQIDFNGEIVSSKRMTVYQVEEVERFHSMKMNDLLTIESKQIFTKAFAEIKESTLLVNNIVLELNDAEYVGHFFAELTFNQEIENTVSLKLLPVSSIHSTFNELSKIYSILDTAQTLTNFGFWRYERNSNTIYLSDYLLKILDLPEKSNVIKNARGWTSRIHPDDVADLLDGFEKFNKSGHSLDRVVRFYLQDQSMKFIELKANQQIDNSGHIILSGSAVDITERHVKHSKLVQSDQLMRNVAQRSTDTLIIFEIERDINHRIVDYKYHLVNSVFENQFGFDQEAVKMNCLSKIQPEVFNKISSILSITYESKEAFQDRFYFPDLDRYYDILMFTPQENYVTTIWRDVTIIVDSENNLKNEAEKYRNLYESYNEAVVLFEIESGEIIEANPAATELLKVDSYELKNKNIGDFIRDKDFIKNPKMNGKAISGLCYNALEQSFNAEFHFSNLDTNNHLIAVVNIRNNEDKDDKNDRLIYRNNILRKIYDNFSDPIVLVENGKIVIASDLAVKLFKLDYRQIEGAFIRDLLVTKITKSNAEEDLKNLINNHLEASETYAWNYLNADNELKIYTLFVTEIDRQMNQKFFIIKDKTDEYQSIQELEFENKLTNQIIEESGLAVWEWFIDTNEIIFVRGWKKLIGYSQEELPTKLEDFEKFMHPSEVNKTYNALTDFLTGKISKFEISFRLKCKNGTYKWLTTKGVAEFGNAKSPSKFIGITSDYTKIKLRENELLKLNADLRTTMDIVKVGYWEIDLISMLFTGSNEAFELLDIPFNTQTTLKHIEKTIYPADQEYFMSQFGNHLQNSLQQTTFRILNSDKEIRYISSVITSVDEIEGSLAKYKGIFQDVTFIAQNILQNKAIESTDEIGSIDLPLAVFTPNKFLMVTDRFAKLVGYAKNELIDNFIDIHQLVKKEQIDAFDNFLSSIENYRNQASSITIELTTKYGKVRNVIVQGSKFQWESQSAYLVVFKDQTKEAFEVDIMRKELNVYKNVSHNATSGFLLLNADAQIIYHNKKIDSIFEYKQDELNGRNFLSLFDENERARLVDEISNISEIKRDAQIELTTKSKSGKELWMQLDIVYTDLEEGNIYIFIHDVNYYKISFNQEKRHTEILTAMVESSTNGVALFNRDLELVVSNEAFAALFESDFDRLNKYITGLGKKHNEVAELLNDLKQGKITETQFLHTANSKESLTIRLNVIISNNETFLMMVAFDQSETENEIDYLKSEISRFKSIFENSPFGNTLVNKDRIIIDFNPAFVQLIGVQDADLENTKLDQFVDSNDLIELRTKFNQLFAGVVNEVELNVALRNIDRQLVYTTILMAPIVDDSGEIELVLVTIVDITEKLKEEQFKLNRERLNTINQIGNRIAHRFNNYLMTIYGNSYVLFHNAVSEEDQLRAQKIIGSVGKVTALTRNLLGFSENYRHIQVEFEVNELVSKIIDVATARSQNQINFETKFESPVRLLKGDPDMIHTAILNIIQNSVDALKDRSNGIIQVDTGIVFFEKDQRLNYGEILSEGEYFRIRISDNAGKIEVNDYEELFDPFYTTKDAIMNAGLGLTAAKSIIQRHNGGIKVAVTPRIETSFFVYLPVMVSNSDHESYKPSEIFVNKGTVNIMVIDDEELVRNVTSELLVKLGYNVYSFATGAEAVKFYSENYNKIQLVLLDLYLPDISGVEVLEKFNSIHKEANVILLSGFIPNEEIQELINTRKCSFIQKPISIDKLAYAISTNLKK